MVRVLARGMRELGMQLPPDMREADIESGAVAHVALDLKRNLVESAVRQGGLVCLVRLGCGIRHFANDPTHIALASARDAADLLARWQRLERYVHSRHRVRVEYIGANGGQLRHVAVRNAPPPRAAEDLVVLGLLVALLQVTGLGALCAWAGSASAWPDPDAVALELAARRGDTARWRLSWRAAGPAADEAPRAARWLEPTIDQILPVEPWHEPLRACAALLLADLSNPLALPALAHAVERPRRSLQRDLARAGLGYASLLAELRCRAGAWRLLHTTMPIAEVGFVCGYADQPHFTRQLQHRVGMTPARYREAFATPEMTRVSR
jgi:AraC-like DNA-binding protein